MFGVFHMEIKRTTVSSSSITKTISLQNVHTQNIATDFLFAANDYLSLAGYKGTKIDKPLFNKQLSAWSKPRI